MDAGSTPISPKASSQFLKEDVLALLTGLGQIMFQNSVWTGGFFLVGIAIASPLMAAGALLGAVVGTLTARLLDFDRVEIHDGLYGFNAALVGIAMLFNFQPQILTFVLVIVGAAISSVVTREMRLRVPFPTYTTPFIVTTWVGIYLAKQVGIPAVDHPAPTEALNMSDAIVNGISEVMFQANIMTGILFIVGILMCSWKGAVLAVVGSILGMIVGMSHHDPVANLSLGIYGYNAALAAMAMALYKRSLLLPIAAAVISVFFTEDFPLTGLAPLTAPFVLACWSVIALDRADGMLQSTGGVPAPQPKPIAEQAPTEHSVAASTAANHTTTDSQDT